jgi:hypothetical protein
MQQEDAMTRLRTMFGLATAAVLLMAANGFAQTSGSAPPDRKPDDQNAPRQFDSQSRKNGDQTLSERLDRSDGVINPPAHVDRGMLREPPPTGDGEMVIKPRPDMPKPQ